MYNPQHHTSENEQQLRRVADALPVLISYIDRDERYRFNNRWYEEWFGESSEQVKGKSMQELLGQQAYNAVEPYVKRALAGEQVTYERKVPYRKRGETYIQATYIPDIGADKEVRGFYALVEDITARHLANEQIRQSEFLFRRLTDTVPAIIWLTDKDGYCTYLNKHWYDRTGQTEEEALGFGWLKATHPDDAEATEKAFIEANTNQKEFISTYRLRQADGQYRWVIDRGSPRFDASGNFEGITGSVIDIHQEKEAERRIRESEGKYRSLFDTMEQGFCIIEIIFEENGKPVDYRFLEVNSVFAQQTGLKNALGKTARELLPNLEQHWFEVYGKVAMTGESTRFSEGSDVMGRWFDVYAFKVGDSRSRNVAILFSDVSERKKSEQQLRKSEERFRALLTATSDVIFRMSPDWKTMQSLHGRSFLDDSDGPVTDWLDKYIFRDDQSRVRLEIARAIESKSVFEMEYRVVRSDGTLRWTFSRAIPLLDSEGNIIEWFGAATDVTERKLTAEALKESETRYRNLASQLEKLVADRTEQLERSNQDLQQFAHVASHDLKEPVRKVKLFIDRLIHDYGGDLPDKALEYLKKIDVSCDRMNTMVEGVLQYSSMNALKPVDETVDLTTIIETIESDLEVVIGGKNASIIKQGLPKVNGSPILLYQLFYNLINNSLKFSKKETPAIITVTSSEATLAEIDSSGLNDGIAYAKLKVKDNGIGFNNEEAENIFGTFTRLHTKDKYEGTGLGLALCKNIVLRHGGAIWAEGNPGSGATFNILLPTA